MNIAWNLANSELAWFCLKYVFVPHPPLFFMVAAFMLKVFGNELLVLRGLCAFYSILTVIVVYLVSREISGKKTGLLSALLFAIYPTAIYWNRMGFANNQLMLFLMLSMYSILLYLNHGNMRWFYLAGILTSLSIITEILGVAIFFAIAVVLWFYEKKRLPGFIILSAMFPMVFVIGMLGIAPDAFISDILHNSGRSNYRAFFLALCFIVFFMCPSKIKDVCADYVDKIYGPVISEIRGNIPLIYLILSLIVFLPLSDEVFVKNFDYFWLGILGLYYIKNKIGKDVLLSFIVSLFVMLLWLNRSDHMITPLYPLFCLGLSVFLLGIYEISLNYFRGTFRKYTTIIALILVFYPICATVYYDSVLFLADGTSLATEDIDSRWEVADFVNERVSAEDVVLTDSHISRMINCKTSVIIQSPAYEKNPMGYMRADYKRDRFLFNCSYRNAKFVIMLEDTREWALNQTALVGMVNEIQNWSSVEVGGYIIYQNPVR